MHSLVYPVGTGAAGLRHADTLRPSPSPEGEVLRCLGEDSELFFAPQPLVVEQAKRVCAPCPIRQQCLTGALQRAEPWGVWGGELFEAGIVIADKRPRGRPRKSVAA